MDLNRVDQVIAARTRFDRARQLRETAGLTQAQLGKEMGISGSAVSRLEGGNRSPRVTTLLRWDTALRQLEERCAAA
jgi:transcriptional regulator with XRE-family HTH domain